MKINTFFYSVKQGFKNIFRNKMFSLASIATMAACIFMFGLFYIIITNFNSAVHKIEEGVSVTVFFDKGISRGARSSQPDLWETTRLRILRTTRSIWRMYPCRVPLSNIWRPCPACAR